MPVLSSFISYRPGRKRGNNNKATIGKISSPFPVQLTNDINTPHPYASPPIIDIHDERGRSPSPSPEPSLERPSNDYYSTSSPPQMRLDVDINPSPLASWFPPDLLKSDPFTVNLGEEAPEASGSKSYHGNGPNVAGLSRLREEYPAQRPSYEEDMDEDSEDEDDEIEAEEVLAGMDISYGDIYPPEDVHGTPTKRPAPTPIKIPNTNIHGPKVQVVRSAEQSRPTSQISSPESSAVSGTSFARALMGNSFFLSSDARGSKYRSGFSTLTRTDSATLPRGEYGLINSPYWRGSTGSSLLSPPIPSAPVPPVPDNADQVYVPPQIGRQSGEPKRSRSANATSISATPTEQEREEAQAHRQDEEDAQALRRISRISETKTSLESTVQDHSTAAEEPGPTNTQTQQQTHNSSYSISSIDKGKSRRYSMMPESVRSDSDIMSDGVGSPSVFSDPPSSGGREDLDNVLDYYQLEESLDQLSPPGGYRLPFSPITEETSSQLSPPAPYNRPDSRSSSIKTPGRYFFGASPSATMGGVRVDWSMKRTSEARSGSRDSISKQLLPIGERPLTTQATSPNGASTHVSRPSIGKNTLGPSSGGDGRSLLPPPPLSTIRGRSGSAPSPIQVLRDSKDLNSYTIMVTPRTGDSGEHTASTDDSEMLRQDFPQTPNAFSPGFSPGLSSATSPRDDSYNGVGEPGPTTPMSALLPSNRAIQPSLAQQVLLTRAATSVHGARHSRQNSLSKMVRMNGGLPPPANRPTSAIVNHTPAGQDPTSSDETLAEKDGSQMGHDYAHSNTSLTSLTSTSSRRNESHPSQSSDSPLIQEPFTEAGSTQSQSPFHGSQEVQLPREGVTSPATTVTVAPASPALSNNTEGSTGLAYMHSQPSSGLSSPQPEGQASQRSSGSHYTPLESPRVLPTVPPSPSVVVPPPPPPPPPPAEPSSNTASPNLTNADIAPSPRVGRVPIPPNQSHIPAPAPPSTTPVMSPPAPLPNSLTTTPIISPSAPLPSSPLVRHPMIINPPPPHARLTSTQGSAASIYGYSMDSAPTGSPPPYSSIVSTHERALDTVNVTPTTSGSYGPNYRFGMTPVSPPANIGRFTTTSEPSSTPGQNTSPLPSRQRARPAIPIGPRRPSAQHPHGHGSLPPSTWAARERGGSVSSVGSAVPASRRVQAQNLPSPKFPTPTPKFRGFTMDAAKWTFTSSQLQDIVSRAIRQSSEASFIRLLQLETLDEEIPDEIDRLEALKSHIKANYKNLSRRRTTLLDSLTSCMDSTDPDAKSRALQFMEDLRDISANLDKLTEELNSVNEQLAQVNHITQLHSTSALAMALRKLNGSFLKQFQEAQTLREQVSSLQAERDEAWKQAEKVANDYDDLRSGLVDSPDSETKLSRVTASRNASVRATKAGLRSASRVSQRLSVGSNSLRGLTTPNSARTTFHEEVPPVPPIPRHRPEEIRTNLPLRNSVTIVSTSTPNSETRAMVRVTEELYDMLGISLNENRGRRSRSVIGLPGEADQAGSPSYSYYDPPPNTGRRNSLPGSAALPPDPYNSLAADVNTILNSDRSGWI